MPYEGKAMNMPESPPQRRQFAKVDTRQATKDLIEELRAAGIEAEIRDSALWLDLSVGLDAPGVQGLLMLARMRQREIREFLQSRFARES